MGKLLLQFCSLLPLVILVSCVAGEKEIREMEPNDGLRVAQDVPLSTVVQGVLASAKDVDMYKLQLNPAEVTELSFRLEQAMSVYEVNLVDDRGRKIVSTLFEKGATGERLIHPNMGGKRKLYIEVRSKDFFHPENYFIYVRRAEGAFSEAEPNGSLTSASSLVNNGTLNATLSPLKPGASEGVSEKDWYRISYKAMNDTSVAVSAYVTPIEGVDIQLHVKDVQGRSVFLLDNNGVGEPEEFFNIRLREPYEAFIELTGSGVFKSDFMPYEINTEVSPFLPPNTSFEPSDSMNQSILFTEEVEEIESRVDFSGDVDFFEIDVNQVDGALLNLVLYPGKEQDLSFEIIDGLGDKVTYSDIEGMEKIESIANLLVYQEKLYAKVTPKADSAIGTYKIKRYYRPYQEGLEKEPNDNVNQSMSIQKEKLYSGYLSREDDIDYFSFNIYEKGHYQLEVMGVSGTEYKVIVMEQDLETITEMENTDSRADISLALDKGTYFVQLSLLLGSEVKSDEIYRIRFSEL